MRAKFLGSTQISMAERIRSPRVVSILLVRVLQVLFLKLKPVLSLQVPRASKYGFPKSLLILEMNIFKRFLATVLKTKKVEETEEPFARNGPSWHCLRVMMYLQMTPLTFFIAAGYASVIATARVLERRAPPEIPPYVIDYGTELSYISRVSTTSL